MYLLKRSIFPLVLMLATCVSAQTPIVSQHTKPGDTLSYYVKFDDDPQFIRVTLQFHLQGTAAPEQKNMPTQFDISSTDKPIQPGTFDVRGKVGECATGNYELFSILVYYIDGNTSHTYAYPANGQQPVTVFVENEHKSLFPPLKSVSPNPPRP